MSCAFSDAALDNATKMSLYAQLLLHSLACINFLKCGLHLCRIDEKPGDPWDIPRVAVDALGAAMLVTIILDLWRIFLGPIIPIPDTNNAFNQDCHGFLDIFRPEPTAAEQGHT